MLPRSQPETQASGSRAPSAAGSPPVYPTTCTQLSNLVSSKHSTLVRALLDWMSFTARREMAMIYPLKRLHLWNQTNCGTEASIFTDTLSNRGRLYAACLQSCQSIMICFCRNTTLQKAKTGADAVLHNACDSEPGEHNQSSEETGTMLNGKYSLLLKAFPQQSAH